MTTTVCGVFVLEKDTIFGFEEIYKAYEECRKGKRNTTNVLKFEKNLEENLLELHSSLTNKSYEPKRSVCFIVLKPKPREIFAADFRDRIVHHLLVKGLEKIFEKRFIFDSFACRKEKGTHKAVKRLKKFMQSYSNNQKTPNKAYFLQLDISNFFMSIDKGILFDLIEDRIKKSSEFSVLQKEELVYLSGKVIFFEPEKDFVKKSSECMWEKVPKHKSLFNTEKNKGLPIGNYSSQFFANVYLHELDFFVKNTLRVKHYVRYVDDFILLSESKDELLNWFWRIKDFVESNLALNLKNKVNLLPISNGIDFLGYIIKPWSVFVRRRVLHNFKKKLLTANKELLENKLFFFEKNSMEERSFRSSFSSYLGHFKHANNFKLKQQVIKEFPFTKMCF
jgi:hypothetical protein